MVVAYQLPYMLSFSGGRWHSPAVGLLFPLAAGGVTWLSSRQGRWRAIRASRSFWVGMAVFALIQVEYAYSTFRNIS